MAYFCGSLSYTNLCKMKRLIVDFMTVTSMRELRKVHLYSRASINGFFKVSLHLVGVQRFHLNLVGNRQ